MVRDCVCADTVNVVWGRSTLLAKMAVEIGEDAEIWMNDTAALLFRSVEDVVAKRRRVRVDDAS